MELLQANANKNLFEFIAPYNGDKKFKNPHLDLTLLFFNTTHNSHATRPIFKIQKTLSNSKTNKKYSTSKEWQKQTNSNRLNAKATHFHKCRTVIYDFKVTHPTSIVPHLYHPSPHTRTFT